MQKSIPFDTMWKAMKIPLANKASQLLVLYFPGETPIAFLNALMKFA